MGLKLSAKAFYSPDLAILEQAQLPKRLVGARSVDRIACVNRDARLGLSWTKITSEVCPDPRTALSGDVHCPGSDQCPETERLPYPNPPFHDWSSSVFCTSRDCFSGHIDAHCSWFPSCLLFFQLWNWKEGISWLVPGEPY